MKKDLSHIKKECDRIAGLNKYIQIDYQENQGMVSYTSGICRINIYLSKMTVATCLDHPKQGKTQMFRRNVTFAELDKIFKNPRVHTNKGYTQKKI